MTRKYTVLPVLMLAAFSLAALPAAAQGRPAGETDRAAVIAVADSLLATIGSHDTLTARRLLAPGARLVSIGAEGGRMTAQTDSMFLRTVAGGPQRYRERMWSPTVTLNGPLAVVSASYDFHIDGTFSHCGTDVFTLMRSAAGWRVVALAWTTQRTGCEPSPLGPPK